MPLNKHLDALTVADLQALIDDAVPEGKTIDYKEARIGNSDKDKKEFLADVSSFANASGGHLVIGVKEDGGLAIGLPGLQGIDSDAEILKLENMVRDGIKPRIPGIAMRSIPISPGVVAIVIHIPRSWAQPHVVDSLGHWRFYSRNSAGKYPLDVGEVRAAFALSESLAERIRLFRTERLGKIITKETPIGLTGTTQIVMHLVPSTAFDSNTRFDLIELADDVGKLAPMWSRGWNHRYNFDGLLTFVPIRSQSTTHSYLQIFRNGIIEAVEAGMLDSDGGKTPIIRSIPVEAELITSLTRYLAIQRSMGISPPVVLMLSLLGVADYGILPSQSQIILDLTRSNSIDRNELVIPDILIEDMNVDAATVLRPAFDAIWNAAGWSRCLNYDDEGNRIGR